MFRTAVFVFALLLFAPFAYCAIYGYVDAEGVYHMTNIRPAGKCNVLVDDRGSSNRPAWKGNLDKNTYDILIKEHSEANGVDPKLVKAVMIAESNGNPNAVSNKGAQGLMQIMPDTAQLLDLRNPFDPGENIQAGTRYLKQLHELFSGNLELVLAAYNAGPRKVVDSKMAIPRISETISYVKKVKEFYSKLKESQ
jgi:soluble lytic murein transglycosylase-like protein